MASFVNENLLNAFSDGKKTLLKELLSNTDMSVQERWFRITTEILEPTVPFNVHMELYKLNYGAFRDYESPAWFPNNHVVKNKGSSFTVSKTNKLHNRMTNIERIMKAKGLTTYSQFYDWSVGMQTCEEYWDTCIKALDIQFETPYSKVFDYSATPAAPAGAPAGEAPVADPHYGIKSVEYLKGARFNVADSCFPRAYLENPTETTRWSLRLTRTRRCSTTLMQSSACSATRLHWPCPPGWTSEWVMPSEFACP